MRRLTLTLSAIAIASTLIVMTVPAHASAPASCAATRTPANFRACITKATAAYTALWAPSIAMHGGGAVPPTIRIPQGVALNPCFDATVGDVAVASFWCNKNTSVYVSAFAAPYWTREYTRSAKEQGVLASDAKKLHRTQKRLLRGYPNQGAATELAHELGHWVQTEVGIDEWYATRAEGDTDVAGAYAAAGEFAADCMAGWVQGRAAAVGAWKNTPFIRWASRATIAELGGLPEPMKPGFVFPKDTTFYAHGESWSRLKLYNQGWTLGVRGDDGITGCANAAAAITGTPAPPIPVA